MNRLLSLLLFWGITTLNAQNITLQNLAGFWRMSNTATTKPSNSFLRIIPLEKNIFSAVYDSEGRKIELAGSLFDNGELFATEYINENEKYIFSGIAENENIITGSYIENGETSGQFTWEKVCDELGNALNADTPPCLEKAVAYRTETRMVKKKIQVADKTTFTGEARDENIPLAETSQDIPANAILVGHIGFDENVTYKDVEIEVAEEVKVAVASEKTPAFANEKKKANTASSSAAASSNLIKNTAVKVKSDVAKSNSKIIGTASAKPETIPTEANITVKVPVKTATSYEYNSSEKAKSGASAGNSPFTTCDVGAFNPSEKIAQMIRGTTVNEAGHTYHIVGNGETMTAISKLYNITIVQLATMNKKDCERIFVGEKLLVK